MSDLLADICASPGRLEAEVDCAISDVRAFVTVTSFWRDIGPADSERWAYLPDSKMLFYATRYHVDVELLKSEKNICERELYDLQRIVLPDTKHLLVVLNLWLPSVEALNLPKYCDAPI